MPAINFICPRRSENLYLGKIQFYLLVRLKIRENVCSCQDKGFLTDRSGHHHTPNLLISSLIIYSLKNQDYKATNDLPTAGCKYNISCSTLYTGTMTLICGIQQLQKLLACIHWTCRVFPLQHGKIIPDPPWLHLQLPE